MKNSNTNLKKEIRKRILSLRNGLDDEWIRDVSIQIEERLFEDKDFLESKNILFYDAFKKEVQTRIMIKRAIDMKKRVFLPVTDFKNKNILISEFTNKGESGEVVPQINLMCGIEIVMVPGVAFDGSGARIGFGMGFYDRFLHRLSKDVKTIGLAFDFQVVGKIPVDSHDFIIDKIITEKRVIDCHKHIKEGETI
ncbi:MAG: 5-formyltetrahydrofolate cyclo-ligase [Nitrospinae bacterium]|nr:5-formyltetrahydrofolate cyclo-ligase [Nitrospinota bacterium]